MSCTSNVAAIAAFCGVNAPMLDRKLYITTLAKVSAIASPTAHVISTDITMVTDQLFYEWAFSKQESSYAAEQDENGMFNITVTVFIEKLQSATSNILNGMRGDNYLAIVTDKNGNARLLGKIGDGCSVSVRETTTPRNGYEVTITWSSAHLPYFYTGAVTTS